ncbi:hypothetical protein CLOBY_27480 [Clostridium saccharobutylicum]|uniref:hypothetical protein n=1 Tax=Clostridium saccharobutylicum TaxID=169679 RepID=UPI000983E376|nr:hypothetical protein [Clostridium saccharobutylicum]AQS10603.1 hypothetical protein CLOBY_27480 [Clostridium saccharobutylicum]MBC2438044.1 hypothetical protein [Clostridium saccharobutylicum]NSB90503.1 hypothetical protein [Clostridium saccharobutylicum]NYC31558.1 hypothetical protein [Clostridium saccharobutylicum]OOM18876.1 hypothetical protein CLSAB_03340 [Clostridium saccharobutylicum]
MDNLVGVVNKPQFDTNVFRVGMAIHVIGNLGGYRMDKDCLIMNVTPLDLKIIYIDNEGDDETLTLGIDTVKDGRVTIRLKEDK